MDPAAQSSPCLSMDNREEDEGERISLTRNRRLDIQREWEKVRNKKSLRAHYGN